MPHIVVFLLKDGHHARPGIGHRCGIRAAARIPREVGRLAHAQAQQEHGTAPLRQPEDDAGIYVCVCMYVYIYVYICMCVYIYIYICVCVCVCVCVYVYIYTYMCVCACAYIYIYIYMYIYLLLCIYRCI